MCSSMILVLHFVSVNACIGSSLVACGLREGRRDVLLYCFGPLVFSFGARSFKEWSSEEAVTRSSEWKCENFVCLGLKVFLFHGLPSSLELYAFSKMEASELPFAGREEGWILPSGYGMELLLGKWVKFSEFNVEATWSIVVSEFGAPTSQIRHPILLNHSAESLFPSLHFQASLNSIVPTVG